MKKENTAIRLKTIMNMRGLRQVDILNLTVPYCQKYSVKMNKSDISQYCSGKTEPNQEKLFILGNALNVKHGLWVLMFLWKEFLIKQNLFKVLPSLLSVRRS